MHSNSSANRNRQQGDNDRHERRSSWQEFGNNHLLLTPFVPLFPFFHSGFYTSVDDGVLPNNHSHDQADGEGSSSSPIGSRVQHDNMFLFITELTNQDSVSNSIGQSSHFYLSDRNIRSHTFNWERHLPSPYSINTPLPQSVMDDMNHLDQSKIIWLPLRTSQIDDDSSLESFDKILTDPANTNTNTNINANASNSNSANNVNDASNDHTTTNTFISKKIKNVMIKLTHSKHLMNVATPSSMHENSPFSSRNFSNFHFSLDRPFRSSSFISNDSASGNSRLIESRIVPMTITSLIIRTPSKAINPLRNGFLFISRDENIDNEIFKPFEDYDYNALIRQYNNLNIHDNGNGNDEGDYDYYNPDHDHHYQSQNQRHDNSNRDGIDADNDSSSSFANASSIPAPPIPPLPQLPSSILAVLYFQLDKNQPDFTYTFKWPVKNAKEIIIKMLGGQLPQLEYDLGYGSRTTNDSLPSSISNNNRFGMEVEFIGLRGMEEPQLFMSSSLL